MTLRKRISRWLDRHGWSSWEHVGFDFANYEPLRQQGLSHKQAVRWLNDEWRRKDTP